MTKICSKCKIEKALSEFCKSKKTSDGLASQCKVCVKQYRQTHKKEIVAYGKKYRDTHKKERAESRRRYYQAHKEEHREWRERYYQKHKEEELTKAKQYRQDNKETVLAYKKKYRKSHKQATAESGRLYRQTLIGKSVKKKSSHKRRALKTGVGIKDFNPVEVLERDNYICQHCGRKTRPGFKNPLHPLYPNLDHIIPLSKGGEHSKENTQCLCRQCNLEKGYTGKGDQLRMFG